MKARAELPQPETSLNLPSDRRIVGSVVWSWLNYQYQIPETGPQWVRIQAQGSFPRTIPRISDVAAFGLIMGHDYLQNRLFELGIVRSKQCPLCGNNRQDGDHQLTFSALALTTSSPDNQTMEANDKVGKVLIKLSAYRITITNRIK